MIKSISLSIAVAVIMLPAVLIYWTGLAIQSWKHRKDY